MGITPQQFHQIQQRLARPGRVAAPVFERPALRGTDGGRVILGLDPSLRGTGYGVIRPRRPTPETLGQGTISCPSAWGRSQCLVSIVRTLREVLTRHKPAVCVVEGLFYAQNLKTAIILGEARGAALATVAEAGLEIFEMAPRKVKQAVVGYGGAGKIAVARMVQRMLGLAAIPDPDAADALALALAYAHETSRYSLAAPKKL